jgi:hypothetical protein
MTGQTQLQRTSARNNSHSRAGDVMGPPRFLTRVGTRIGLGKVFGRTATIAAGYVRVHLACNRAVQNGA